MEFIDVQVRSHNGRKNRIALPSNLYHKGKDINKLQIGHDVYSCSFFIHPHSSSIHLPQHMFERLHINSGEELPLHFAEDKLILRPLIGIWMAGFNWKGPIYPKRTAYAKELLQTGAKMGFTCFLFGYQHIDWETKTIRGFQWEKEEWKQKSFPVPNVIYNRLPNRKVEQHPFIKDAYQKISKHSTIFNPSFFDKGYIHEMLMEDPICHPYIPETILHPSLQGIKAMIEEHPSIYIKPRNGSVGKGLILLKRDRIKNHYQVDRYHKGKVETTYYPTLTYWYDRTFPKGAQGYLAQPDVQLQKKKGFPVDFRVHTNKNDIGEWEVSLIACKFAGKGSITTHVEHGGKVFSLEEIFTAKETDWLKRRLTQVSLQMSKVIDKNIEGTVAEIGFDLGIDEEGRIWLFEANSKPGVHIFQTENTLKLKQNALRFPFLFATYLLTKNE
ncbi:YheC/YheD family protein [Bacillaceae bacterium S4-13-58]